MNAWLALWAKAREMRWAARVVRCSWIGHHGVEDPLGNIRCLYCRKPL